ncbi:MAG: hypothetical protein NTW49_01690 [Bacteroidia bacterium]|nr:hypothetical protein [Bacteroidia bacterium]
MFEPKSFYSFYQVNYYDYKQLTNKYLLDNIENLDYTNQVTEYTQNGLRNTIISDIRLTYLHSIETVFTFILALLPDKSGHIDDYNLVRNISGLDAYKWIVKISKDEKELDILDNKIIINDNESISLWQYIFYFGLSDSQYRQGITDSIKVIRHGLSLLAKELADRNEFNSYKHCLRIYPSMSYFSLIAPETNDTILHIDFEKSLTYYSRSENELEHHFTSFTLDSERDINMTSFCSGIIWNIIKLRDAHFNKSGINKVLTIFWTEDILNELKKYKTLPQHITFNIKM